ncbi:transposon-encoded TnpW family protein [Clostridium magnum]|uniref:transposon-encoded TnpW family protein n=1 Tax=Clostridium magnum TaxID=33954 RepID=UPI0008331E65
MKQKKQDVGSNSFTRHIGTTVYQVKVFFDESAETSAEDKLMHLISNDLSIGKSNNSNCE